MLQKSSISEDRVLTVESHMEHIISLLNNELERSKDSLSVSACLDHFLKNHILSKVFQTIIPYIAQDFIYNSLPLRFAIGFLMRYKMSYQQLLLEESIPY